VTKIESHDFRGRVTADKIVFDLYNWGTKEKYHCIEIFAVMIPMYM